MVQKIFRFIRREVANLHAAAYIVAFLTLFAQILALVRDRVFAHTFGVGEVLDLYYAAFRIPDILFALFASLVSAYILIPLLADAKDALKTKQLLSETVSFFVLVLGVVSGILFFFVGDILEMLYPTLSGGDRFSEFVLLTQILLLQPILLGLSSILGSITQIQRRFFLFALSPVLYNVGIIIGVIFFEPIMGLPGLAWGVVLGAILHLSLHIPIVLQTKVFPRFTIPRKETVGQVVGHSLPRSLALSANTLMEAGAIILIAPIAVGAVTVFSFANNLQHIPLALIGASYAVVAFPTLARLHAEKQLDTFLERVATAARHLIVWSMFAVVIFIVLRAHLVRVVLGSGEFTWDDTRLTAAVLALLMLALVGQALILLIARAYYAGGKSFVPLYIQAFGALSSLGAAILFLWVYATFPAVQYFFEALLRISYVPHTEVVAAALGIALGQILAGTLAIILFTRTYPGFWREIAPVMRESFAAAIVAGAVAYGALLLLGGIFALTSLVAVLAQGILAGTLGLVVFVGVLTLLANREVAEMRAGIDQIRAKRLEPQSEF